MHGDVPPQPLFWSWQDFSDQLAEANRRDDFHWRRNLLRAVAKNNYHLVKSWYHWDVSKTYRIPHADLGMGKNRVYGHGQEPNFTFSEMTTGEALFHFAKRLRASDSKAFVCALNFANGEHVGGGYLSGARAQEEELCRQFPALYTSLKRARDKGDTYPFGPATLSSRNRQRNRYADVLYTEILVARRASQREGYRLLDDSECLRNMSLVSAAAPNIKKGEVFDDRLMLNAMTSIMVAPRLKNPDVETLVLGAWGCGAFGNDPRRMARLFARVLFTEKKLGHLYREVHFAIPGGNENSRAFELELLNEQIPLRRLDSAGGPRDSHSDPRDSRTSVYGGFV